jgi:alpha-N-arabinofuranosidase
MSAYSEVVIGDEGLFDLSAGLYMQFMEPLGVTDGSVEAGWDHLRDRWRPDLVKATRELSPGVIRWGGCLSSFYRWKEAVGPRKARKPMLNLLWGGVESNQVGTVEFLDFCRRVGAAPLMSVNFESDGRMAWAHPAKGGSRWGSAAEAAQWVDYCNNPDNALRRQHGLGVPYRVGLWQIGNETSYDRRGYKCEQAAQRTVAFAKAMRRRDPSIELIGWGDNGWGPRMMEIAGEHLNYLAFHNMFKPLKADPHSPLQGMEYRKDPARTWEHLMRAHRLTEERILRMRQSVSKYKIPLAMTESHFSVPGRNRCEVLSTWGAGVANARVLNVQARHGDVLKIATAADFCGTRWMVNAVMIPVPFGKSFLMPVGRVMALFGRHVGKEAVKTKSQTSDLDVTASRNRDRHYLHVVNTQRKRAVRARLSVSGRAIVSGRVFTIAEDPEMEVWTGNAERLEPREISLSRDGMHTFPAASVSAVEIVSAEANKAAPLRRG